MIKSSIKKSFRMQKSIEMNTRVAHKVCLVNFMFAMMYPTPHTLFLQQGLLYKQNCNLFVAVTLDTLSNLHEF